MRAAGLSEQTIKLRAYHLGRVAAAFPGSPWATETDALTAWLGSQRWAPATRRSYRSTLRAFYRWGIEAERTTANPVAKMPPVRVPRGLPRPAPDDTIREALAGAGTTALGLAILLAATSGLRRGELARVHSRDLRRDPDGWSLIVRGKGGHVRSVPLTGETADLLRRVDGWAFPSPHGGHLTAHHLGKTISARLEGHTTHSLRHRAATAAYRHSRDLRAVQELLGHARPETTAVYAAVDPTAVRASLAPL